MSETTEQLDAAAILLRTAAAVRDTHQDRAQIALDLEAIARRHGARSDELAGKPTFPLRSRPHADART